LTTREVAARYRWAILGLAFAGQMGYSVCFQAVAPLAPLFQPELGLTNVQVGFFSAAVSAGSAVMVLAAGSLTDRLGVRRVMSFGLVMCGAFMLSMAVVASFWQAMAVMFAAGMGGALVLPGVSKAIMDWFPPSTRATAMGLKQAAVPVGGALTASTLPALALLLGWRPSVAVVGILSVGAGGATALLYRDFPVARRGWGAGTTVWVGLKAVLRNGRLWAQGIIAVTYVTVQLALSSYLALYFSDVVLVPLILEQHARIVAAGGYLALCQAGGVFGRVCWGVVSDRVFHGRRVLVLAIVGAIAAPLGLVVSDLGRGYPAWLLAVIVFVYGATAIGWNGLYHVLTTETAGLRYAATGMGFGMTLNQVGTVGGAPLFGFVVDWTGSYRTAWTVLAGLSTVGTLTSVVLARGERKVGQTRVG